jgi:hypothetical protein
MHPALGRAVNFNPALFVRKPFTSPDNPPHPVLLWVMNLPMFYYPSMSRTACTERISHSVWIACNLSRRHGTYYLTKNKLQSYLPEGLRATYQAVRGGNLVRVAKGCES